MTEKYIGVISYLKETRCLEGHIDLESIRAADGTPARPVVDGTIFVNSSDLGRRPRVGMEIAFDSLEKNDEEANTYRPQNAQETESSAITHLANGGISLAVRGTDRNSTVIDTPLLLMSWRLSPELVEWAAQERKRGREVRLFVIAWPLPVDDAGEAVRESDHRSSVEVRKLFRLDEPFAPITFGRPGPFRIVATLVSAATAGRLRDAWIAREFSSYNSDIISCDGMGFVSRQYDWFAGSGLTHVNIPAGLFAERPRDWKWVNYGRAKSDLSLDSCSTKARRAYAYGIQPLVVLVTLVALEFMLVAKMLACWSVGIVGLDYQALLHPLDPTSPYRLKPRRAESIFVWKRDTWTIPGPAVVSPLVLGLVAGITLAIGRGYWLWDHFAILFAAAVGIFGIATGLCYLKSLPEAEETEEEKEERARKLREELARMPAEPFDLRTLPLRPWTLKYFHAAVKQKFCKFYAAT